jgi:hypothetical protein
MRMQRPELGVMQTRAVAEAARDRGTSVLQQFNFTSTLG